MTEPLLAKKWEGQDPTNWWMSEKLDGCRALWNGEKFLSRQGKEFHAPDWFKQNLRTNFSLDGELWGGRSNFQKTVSALRKLRPIDSEWEGIKYVVFDAPTFDGKFEERIDYLLFLFPEFGKEARRVEVLEHKKCANLKHLNSFLSTVQKKGGEGVMLRKPLSLYESGRSDTLLKVKTFFDDEAIVIEHLRGKGRNQERLGALKVQWKEVQFKIGTGLSDEQRENPPIVGSKVTFRYQELSRDGIPRFPSFVSVRDYE
jgi:DNA ligase-1